MNAGRTKVWAHRGASGYAPENTMIAFKKAAEMQADGIELDVQLSKDGEIVVIHDETVDRVSGVHGYVKDFTLAQLKQLNCNQTHPEYDHAEIPMLREVYEFVKPTGMIINVELKTGEIFYPHMEARVLELTKQCGMEEQVIYSSFNHYTLRKLKELQPNVQTGMLYADGIFEAPAYAREKLDVDALHPALYNLQYPDYLTECRKRGLKIHVWTVNEEEQMRACCRDGIDAIITNYPDVARKIVEAAKL